MLGVWSWCERRRDGFLSSAWLEVDVGSLDVSFPDLLLLQWMGKVNADACRACGISACAVCFFVGLAQTSVLDMRPVMDNLAISEPGPAVSATNVLNVQRHRFQLFY